MRRLRLALVVNIEEEALSKKNTAQASTIWQRKAPATIVGVIILAIVGSLLYDIVVKPGLSTLSRVFLDIFTLGSETVKDIAYQQAAVDPTPISALILVTLVFSVITFPAVAFLLKMLPHSKTKLRLKELQKLIDENSADNTEELLQEYETLLRKRRNRFLAFFIPCTLLLFLPLSIHNQSILIWRVFHANHNIISPYIDEQQRLILLSKFASMQTKKDYLAIEKQIYDIAKENDVEVQDYTLW